MLSTYIPQQKGDIDGGVDVPLQYVFTYEKSGITDLQNYAFIRGRLMTFAQMEQYKIYEDAQYVCYEVSHLFYSDLRRYVESMVSQRSDAFLRTGLGARAKYLQPLQGESGGASGLQRLRKPRRTREVTGIRQVTAHGQFPEVFSGAFCTKITRLGRTVTNSQPKDMY
ncbi:MAG: hypothetical protein HFH93_12965 [Lachnospiraceae bacterium]|nr:hypothetical protein [Lachnospiraceae bacterium]